MKNFVVMVFLRSQTKKALIIKWETKEVVSIITRWVHKEMTHPAFACLSTFSLASFLFNSISCWASLILLLKDSIFSARLWWNTKMNYKISKYCSLRLTIGRENMETPHVLSGDQTCKHILSWLSYHYLFDESQKKDKDSENKLGEQKHLLHVQTITKTNIFTIYQNKQF